MEKVNLMISKEDINKRLEEIASLINEEFKDEEVILVCILKGSIYIMCDISQHLTMPVTIDFMSVSSYGDKTESSGRVRIIKDLDEDIEGKNVIIVEDIIDSGRTLSYLTDLLKARRPKKLKICTLLDKPDRRVSGCILKVDYVGFVIEDKFVVGYGMDYAQKYRNLPYIGALEL